MIPELPKFVLKIAHAVWRDHARPPNIEFADVLQSAHIAYWLAVSHYDPSRHASLETYAGIRVRGEIIDEYRKADLGWRSRSRVNYLKPLFVALEEAEDRADGGVAPDEVIGTLERERALMSALPRLSDQQRAVLNEHYWEGRTKQDISASFGLSPSRIGQIVREAVRTLREMLL